MRRQHVVQQYFIVGPAFTSPRRTAMSAYLQPTTLKVHGAVLTYVGEIPWGPPYYSLQVKACVVPGRIFGGELAWSDDLRLLAVQEWLSTSVSQGPMTRAAIIDATTMMIAVLSLTKHGFARNFHFQDGRLHYTKDIGGSAMELDVVLTTITNWVPLCGANRASVSR